MDCSTPDLPSPHCRPKLAQVHVHGIMILYNHLILCQLLLCLPQSSQQTAQLVKNLPAMQETLVQFLGWEDPPEKG